MFNGAGKFSHFPKMSFRTSLHATKSYRKQYALLLSTGVIVGGGQSARCPQPVIGRPVPPPRLRRLCNRVYKQQTPAASRASAGAARHGECATSEWTHLSRGGYKWGRCCFSSEFFGHLLVSAVLVGRNRRSYKDAILGDLCKYLLICRVSRLHIIMHICKKRFYVFVHVAFYVL